jgi:hypothetical protein
MKSNVRKVDISANSNSVNMLYMRIVLMKNIIFMQETLMVLDGVMVAIATYPQVSYKASLL